jgi:hypothetical protein
LLALPVQRQRRAFLHLIYSTETPSRDEASFRAHMTANVRVYEPLRRQCALWSSYHEATKSTDLRKPATSNGLYTLLYAGYLLLINNLIDSGRAFLFKVIAIVFIFKKASLIYKYPL